MMTQMMGTASSPDHGFLMMMVAHRGSANELANLALHLGQRKRY